MKKRTIILSLIIYFIHINYFYASTNSDCINIMNKPIYNYSLNSDIARNYQSFLFKYSDNIEVDFKKNTGIYTSKTYKKNKISYLDRKINIPLLYTPDIINYYKNLALKNNYEIIYLTNKDLTVKKDDTWIYYYANNEYYEIHQIEKSLFVKNLFFNCSDDLSDTVKIKGFQCIKNIYKKYDSYNFVTGDKQNKKFITIKGEYNELFYKKIDTNGNIDYSFCYEEIIKNFSTESIEKNIDIFYETDDEFVANKGNLRIYINAGNGMYTAKIIKEKEFERNLNLENDDSIYVTPINDFKITKKEVEKNIMQNIIINENYYKKIFGDKHTIFFEKNTSTDNNDIMSKEEIIENYIHELNKIGGLLIYRDENTIHFKLRKRWIKINANENEYKIIVINENKDLFNSYIGDIEITKLINNKKSIVFENIIFHKDTDNLKINSIKQINEIIKYLKSNKKDKLDIIYIEKLGNEIVHNVKKTDIITSYIQLFFEENINNHLTIYDKNNIIETDEVVTGLFIKLGE